MSASASAAPTAPQQSFRWARPFIPKRLQPMLRGLRKRVQLLRNKTLAEPYRTIFPFTQAAMVRQENLVRLAEIIERENIPGALVECGVLDGGMSALMAWATRASARPLHMFDAWEGLPDTTAEDGADARVWSGEVVGSPRRVAAVMRKLGVDAARLHYHRGWFNDTFPHADIPHIALLHVDADFYEPTKLILARWYPHISPGGFIQFDDYDSFAGCRKAVDEFLADHPELRLEHVAKQGKSYFLRKPGKEETK
jgi:O-methyltransferase